MMSAEHAALKPMDKAAQARMFLMPVVTSSAQNFFLNKPQSCTLGISKVILASDYGSKIS
jgi:hypothetical protein